VSRRRGLRGAARAALLLALATGPLPAQWAVAPELRFLEGVWSAECPNPHVVFYRREGRLHQRGLLLLGDLSLSPTEMVPATPAEVRRRGDRLVVTAKAQLAGTPVVNIGHFDQVSERRMRLVRLIACAGGDCRETRLEKALHRCDPP